jgi:hypothetical protein
LQPALSSSFVIAGTALGAAMTNGELKMENGKR